MKRRLFSFIIMSRNSIVRGLHNPVCLWIVVLYNAVSPCTMSPYLKISLLRFGTFRKRYASREVRANFRPSHLPFGDVTHSLVLSHPAACCLGPQSFPISYPRRAISGIINEREWYTIPGGLDFVHHFRSNLQVS